MPTITERSAESHVERIRDRLGGNRLRAMELLQTSRSELSHSTLLAVVDSAVRWLDENMDHQAMDLLSAVDDEVGTAVYFTLIGHPMPVAPAQDEPTTMIGTTGEG